MEHLKPSLICLSVALIISSCGQKQESTESQETEAPEEKNIVGEEITYELDTLNMQGYIAYDENQEGKRPGILVVHEWWGHNEHARNSAEKLAELGYTALAVDMYGDGKQADHPDKAGEFASAVMSNIESAKARFLKAKEVLESHETVNSEQIGAIGYCFGGGVVLHMARFGYNLEGVVSFHGSLGTEYPAEEGEVQASILVCHGADDPFVPQEQVEAFKQEMDSANVDYEFIAYEGAKHSFTNPQADEYAEKFDMPIAYNEEADEKSWEDMKGFFDRVFKE